MLRLLPPGLLLPTQCAACGAVGPSPCATCWVALTPAPPVEPIGAVTEVRGLLSYTGPGRELVARLKYRNQRATIAWLADGMADRIRALGPPDPRIITWAPTTAARRRDRGFDQAELLARAVARRLGWPCRGELTRGGGPPQTGRSGHERRQGPSFTARRAPIAPAASVVVIDDVLTTGATIAAAGDALRRAGWGQVCAAVAAVTPRRSG
ncbi:MAG: ComF family protein [Acidimicrobiales bacterium]